MTTSNPILTPEQLDHFRERLHQEATHLAEVRASLESGLEGTTLESPSERGALNEDAAADLTVQEQFGSQTRDLANAIHAIETALERIEAGTFGRCADCGNAIPMARLEFLPTAERDVACEEKRNRTRRR